MSPERRHVPEPIKTNDVLTAAVGAAAFAVAFVVLLIVPLPARDHWWRWVCVTGFAMGLFGCWYIPRLQRAREAAAARHDPTDHPAR
ncbi:MAG: DUF2530 domain-containing protein [Actinoallomurus sp.]